VFARVDKPDSVKGQPFILPHLLPGGSSGTPDCLHIQTIGYGLAHMYGFCCCTSDITVGFVRTNADAVAFANNGIAVRTAKLALDGCYPLHGTGTIPVGVSGLSSPHHFMHYQSFGFL